MQGCSELAIVMPASESGARQDQARASTRLKLDYLETVMTQGEYYSLPIVNDNVGDDARNLALVDASTYLESHCENPMFFQVVDMGLKRKKLLNTEKTRLIKMMAMPATVQRCQPWPRVDYPAAAHSVYMDGYPDVIDILRSASWTVIRSSLRSWRSAVSEVDGCINLLSSELVGMKVWDHRLQSAPAVVFWDCLVSEGWQMGEAPLAHTLTTLRIFPQVEPLR